MNQNRFNRFVEFSKIDKKSYQEEGVRWCIEKEMEPNGGVRGGFICDEMGLGKTIMMLAVIVVNFIPKTLIVLPNALMEQWKKEIYNKLGHSALIYHGNNKKSISLEMLNKSIIVITTYGTLASDSDLHNVSWSRVIFDEAHNIKNKNTKRFSYAFRLKAKICWLVTGTPLQNSLSDFRSLASLLRIHDKENEYICKHFVLKRTKKDVGLDLKPIVSSQQVIPFASPEKRVLNKINHTSVLVRFLRERQMCIFPPMIQYSNVGSSKMDNVIKKIVENNNNNGKLVFCHFRQEMDEIKRRLEMVGMDKIHIYDGRVNMNQRNNILKEKNNVLILQIKTCCEGLNLQEHYSEIYFVSPHWNPSVESQAIARCHRYGQQKDVHVYRFYIEESIEQYILGIQKKKNLIVESLFEL
jgi:SNF2 family DNA or RNA helicase